MIERGHLAERGSYRSSEGRACLRDRAGTIYGKVQKTTRSLFSSFGLVALFAALPRLSRGCESSVCRTRELPLLFSGCARSPEPLCIFTLQSLLAIHPQSFLQVFSRSNSKTAVVSVQKPGEVWTSELKYHGIHQTILLPMSSVSFSSYANRRLRTRRRQGNGEKHGGARGCSSVGPLTSRTYVICFRSALIRRVWPFFPSEKTSPKGISLIVRPASS